MEFKIKKLTKLIISILECEVCKVKIIKMAIIGVLSVLLLDFTSWRELWTHALLIGLCATDLEGNNHMT